MTVALPAFAPADDYDPDASDESARSSTFGHDVDELQLEAEVLLEFDRVREFVAGHARMVVSEEEILSSHPARYPEKVARLQAETAEARALLESKGDIGLQRLADIRPMLRRAMLGGVLDGGEIRDVCAVYEAAWMVKEIVERMGARVPLLAEQAGLIHDLREVRDQVEHALSPTGDVLDRATPRLGKLRQRVSVAYKRLFDQLARFTQQQVTKVALRSDVIASRNGRLVLEVKASFKSSIPGVVHGVSGSGQTVFIEPTAAVNAGNAWHEALDAAQREEQRVLRKLTATIASSAEEALISVRAAASIDIAMARARYASATESVAITPQQDYAGNQRISLVDARHPLLGAEAVPITLRIDADYRGLVITGPNTGGKTVAMKTLGLFAMMYQSGMMLPCNEATTLPVFSGVYADIGDAQSIDRSVSTFSSHMQRVVNISHRVAQSATCGGDGLSALVLLDELGTGTDMDEGSALARAILDDLVRRDAWVCVTTHHRTVADFAAAHPKLQNASVEVDSTTMLPNYNVIMGAPGRSYALHVAKRLGLAEDVLERARGMIDPRREQADEYIERVREEALRERETLAKLQREATRHLADAQRMSAQAQEHMTLAERESEEMVEQAREQLMQEAQRVRRDLRKAERTTEAGRNWREARRAVDNVVRPVRRRSWLDRPEDSSAIDSDSASPPSASERKDDKAPHDTAAADASVPQPRDIQVGDTVRVTSMGLTGTVESFGVDGKAMVKAGAMSLETSIGLLELVAQHEEPDNDAMEDNPDADVELDPVYMPSADLDVRGSRAHHIESMLRQFIDHAFMHGLSTVRIIHGRGTGALREVVREVLGRESQVSGWYTAPEDKGGDAATIATLG